VNHIAAIHASSKQLGQTREDYEALLIALTGKASCKAMSPLELARVRAHFDRLTGQHSPARKQAAGSFKAAYAAASPKQRKVHALWGAMGRLGKLEHPAPQGLRHVGSNACPSEETPELWCARPSSFAGHLP
jgi:phage gp16-like protein